MEVENVQQAVRFEPESGEGCFDAFSECSNLTTCVIPQGVKSIGRHAFDGCRN